MVILSLIMIGLLSGTIGSLAGLGGGIVTVPALLFLGNGTGLLPPVAPQTAVGTSLAVIIFTALSATLSYMKEGVVDYRNGLLLFAGSGPAALAGAWLNHFLDINQFYFYFGIFVMAMAGMMFLKDRAKKHHGDTAHAVPLFSGLGVAMAVGLMSGLFGIGGGALMIPAMVLLFRFNIRAAVATSMFIIFFSASLGTVAHFLLGNVSWLYAAALIPGAWLGGKLGAGINKRLKSRSIELALRVLLVIIGIQLMLKGM